MRIAMVSPYSWAHPGGVNNHVEGLARQMVARGHEVFILAPDAPQRGGLEQVPSGQPVPEGVEFLDAGRSVPVPTNGSIANIALLPGTGSRVRRALGRSRPDVVHVHEPMVPMTSSASVLATSSRVVGTFHAAGDRSALYALAALARRKVHARIDFLIAVSEPARELASRYFQGDYEIVPNGVDTSRFAPGMEPPRGFPPGKVVLFVGRGEPRKGLGLLLEAFPLVRESVGDCSLVLVGSGIDAREVARRLPRGLEQSVTVAGFVANDDLPAYYSASDVLCAPALGGESFGVVLIEAMASGTPVVASDISGYSGVLAQTGGGVLFESGDAESLARSLSDLLTDDGRRAELSRVGLESIGSFSWERLAERIEGIYRG